MSQSKIAPPLLAWFDVHGRHDLPWQVDPSPYSVWVSEIMLQQTQVATVVRYYDRFMGRFPTVEALADADLDSVLALWAGLGYYARARNLKRAAEIVVKQFGGSVPTTHEALVTLPGIGRSTAGAILALSMGQRLPILDGNVKRVLARYFAVAGWPGLPVVERALWQLADENTPAERVAAYTQAVMDLGAKLCTRTRPACTVCPLAADCRASALGTQMSFPAPRPKRERPHRRATMLVVVDAEGRVLLERRPARGIWGGLSSLPELAAGDTPEAWCARQLGAAAAEVRDLAVIEHGFTHFDLDIEPKLVRLATSPRAIMDREDVVWYNADSESEIGVPAPVAVLLQSLHGIRRSTSELEGRRETEIAGTLNRSEAF